MNQLLKFTFFLGLSLLLCVACGNSKEQKTEIPPKEAPSMTEAAPSDQIAPSAGTPEASTAEASKPNNASKPDHSQATQKASKTVELPPTKTKTNKSGRGKSYKLTLAERASGTWRNVDDAKDMMVFSENQLIRMYNNKMLEAVNFKMYENCPQSCLGKEEAERGLNCLSIAEKNGDQCYLLLELDRVKMWYRMAGSGKIYKYRRQF